MASHDAIILQDDGEARQEIFPALNQGMRRPDQRSRRPKSAAQKEKTR
jgi:hypothetical protein